MTTPKIKHDWYQTETHVVVTILAKNSNDVKVEYGERTVSDQQQKFQDFIINNEIQVALFIVTK